MRVSARETKQRGEMNSWKMIYRFNGTLFLFVTSFSALFPPYFKAPRQKALLIRINSKEKWKKGIYCLLRINLKYPFL